MGMLEADRTVEIEAPVERCYEIIADLDSTPDWQESMISLDVLERDRDGRAVLVETVSDAKVKQVTSRISFTYHPPDEMRWEQEKGEMKKLTGSWKLESLGDDRTRATYSLRADPGMVLGLLLRGPVEGKVKEFLTKDAAEGLKRQAEGG
jgi:uncharacterized membrane protein